MTVLNKHHPATGFLDRIIKSVNVRLRPRSLVKHEILLAFRVFDVAPQHINWESILCEIIAAFDQHFCRIDFPLAVVEAKRVDGWNRCVSTQFRKSFVVRFGTEGRAKNKELHSTTLTGEACVSAWTKCIRIGILEQINECFGRIQPRNRSVLSCSVSK